MYRPDNWEEVKPRTTGEYASGAYNNGVEAGANAMLKALTEKGAWMTPEQMKLLAPDREYPYGWLVFIPEG